MKTRKTEPSSESNTEDTSGTLSFSRCELPPGMAYQYENADIARTRVDGAANTSTGICPNDFAREYMDELEVLELNQDIRDPNQVTKNTTLLPTVAEAPESSISKPVIPPIPKPPLKPVLPQVSPQPQPKRTKYWLMALAVLLIVIATAVVCVLLFVNDDEEPDKPDPIVCCGPNPNPDPVTTPPTTPQKHYSLSLSGMVNKSTESLSVSVSFTNTVNASIGVTETLVTPLIYDTNEFGMFRLGDSIDEETDMLEVWNTTILSVEEWDGNVAVNTTLLVILRSAEFANEIGAEEYCKNEWLYSVTLDSPAPGFLPDILSCDWGTAGIWYYQVGSNVTSVDDPDPDPVTTPPTTPQDPDPVTTPPTTPEEPYKLEVHWMLNKTVEYVTTSQGSVGGTFMSIGVATTYDFPYVYDTSEFGMFRREEDVDETTDMLELWNFTILSVEEWNANVEMNTTLLVRLRNAEFADELGAAEEFCKKEWLYSVTLDSPSTHSLPPVSCDWGIAGIWDYQVRHTIETRPGWRRAAA